MTGMRRGRWASGLLFLSLFAAPERAVRAGEPPFPSAPRAEHVIVISIDGLRPDAIDRAPAERLRALMRQGAYCSRAETIRPSLTLPAHASMVTGLDYRRHGVSWNSYRPGAIAHPTLFSIAHGSGRSTAFLFGKEKFHYLASPGAVDWLYGEPPPPLAIPIQRNTIPQTGFFMMAALHALTALWVWLLLTAAIRSLWADAAGAGGGGGRATKRAGAVFLLLMVWPIVYVAAVASSLDRPLFDTTEESGFGASALAETFEREWPKRGYNLTFVHMSDPDEAGHYFSWMGPKYLRAVERCDRAVGVIVDTVRKAGRLERTAIIVTADHGGSGRRHYDRRQPDKPEHVAIPWICVGPKVPAGLTIDRAVRAFDTMPTALAFLGIAAPEGIEGRVVNEVLK